MYMVVLREIELGMEKYRLKSTSSISCLSNNILIRRLIISRLLQSTVMFQFQGGCTVNMSEIISFNVVNNDVFNEYNRNFLN